MVADRKPENETEDYFSYELSPYPMSLFKDGAMRPACSQFKVEELLNLDQVLSRLLQMEEPFYGAANGKRTICLEIYLRNM